MLDMNVVGYAALTPCGFAKFDLRRGKQALLKPHVQTFQLPLCHSQCEILRIPKYELDIDLPVAVLRRMGIYTSHVLYCVLKAMQDAQITKEDLAETGLIVSSAMGPSSKIDQYISKVVEFGEMGASPLHFSMSIYNAATSFISQTLQLVGPAFTLTTANLSLTSALQIASGWLHSHSVKRVLVVAGDEFCHFDGYDFNERKILVTPEMYNPLSLNQAIGGEAMIGLVLEKSVEKNMAAKAQVSVQMGLSIDDLNHAKQGVLDAQGGYFLHSEFYQNKHLRTNGHLVGATPAVASADLALALEEIEKHDRVLDHLYQVSPNGQVSMIEVSKNG